MMWIQLFLLVPILLIKTTTTSTDKLVCYFGSWSVYRPGSGKYDVENIDPFLCTHLVYAFVGISSDGSIRVLDRWNDVDKKAFARFNKLKLANPKLKTLIGVGGWNEGSTTFSAVAANAQLRNKFVQNAVAFIQQYGFDGLDMDWEYPVRRGGIPDDKSNFVAWLKEFRQVFDQHGMLVTAAVSATSTAVDTSYDVPAVSRYLDFINVMTYDFHGSWDDKTGQNSPLYPSSLDTTPQSKELNIDACIRSWMSKGAPPEKLILGTGTYGRSFRLINSDNHSLGAPISGPGTAGPYTRQTGMLGYNEIVEGLNSKQWNVVWDNEQKVPYAYGSDQWVGFDNPESLKLKVEYAKALKLGGVMVWSVETDDFQGVSGSKNPLLHTIRSNLNLEPVTPLPPKTTTSKPPTSSSTSPKPPSTFQCSKQGYFRDPVNCSIFYFCLSFNGKFLKYTFRCPDGLVFNSEEIVCVYKDQYPCQTLDPEIQVLNI